MEVINTVGRRKAAIARIYLSEGKGQIVVNDRDYKDYFSGKHLHYIVEQPLNLLNVRDKYDLKVILTGGGSKGQAEAMRLAISRALVEINPDDKKALKAEGFIIRDPRQVERKKPGQPKARKKFQFSKR
ncbi:MAG TPA: 30S ribosomal protein S9 [Bacteroidales bacterium]|nr:30S ribosomal protein S9 [Bacteroidales bacterium]